MRQMLCTMHARQKCVSNPIPRDATCGCAFVCLYAPDVVPDCQIGRMLNVKASASDAKACAACFISARECPAFPFRH